MDSVMRLLAWILIPVLLLHGCGENRKIYSGPGPVMVFVDKVGPPTTKRRILVTEDKAYELGWQLSEAEEVVLFRRVELGRPYKTYITSGDQIYDVQPLEDGPEK